MRHQKPAVYNEGRLNERPIPFVGDVENDTIDDFDSFNSESLENDDHNESSNVQEAMVSIETLGVPANEISNQNENENPNDNASDTQEDMISIGTINETVADPLAISIKVEEAYIEMNESERDELYSFLHLNGGQDDESEIINEFEDENDENGLIDTIQDDNNNPGSINSNTINTNDVENSIDNPNQNIDIGATAGGESSGAHANQNGQNQNDSTDEIEIVSVGVFGFPQPLRNVTASALTKQENDVLSRNLPFSVKVRLYNSI